MGAYVVDGAVPVFPTIPSAFNIQSYVDLGGVVLAMGQDGNTELRCQRFDYAMTPTPHIDAVGVANQVLWGGDVIGGFFKPLYNPIAVIETTGSTRHGVIGRRSPAGTSTFMASVTIDASGVHVDNSTDSGGSTSGANTDFPGNLTPLSTTLAIGSSDIDHLIRVFALITGRWQLLPASSYPNIDDVVPNALLYGIGIRAIQRVTDTTALIVYTASGVVRATVCTVDPGTDPYVSYGPRINVAGDIIGGGANFPMQSLTTLPDGRIYDSSTYFGGPEGAGRHSVEHWHTVVGNVVTEAVRHPTNYEPPRRSYGAYITQGRMFTRSAFGTMAFVYDVDGVGNGTIEGSSAVDDLGLVFGYCTPIPGETDLFLNVKDRAVEILHSPLPEVCAGALDNQLLWSDAIPPSTIRPPVVMWPAGATVDTEWVVASCPRGNPTTGGYVVELRYVSTAGDRIQLGPVGLVAGGLGFSGLDGDPGMVGIWDNGHKVLALHAFNACVITDPGSLTTPPVAGPVQAMSVAHAILADCPSGLFLLDWHINGSTESPPNTVMLHRRQITGSTIGAESVTPMTYHFPGTPTGGVYDIRWGTSQPVGPFGGPKITSWNDNAGATWMTKVEIDRTAVEPVFSTPTTPFYGTRNIMKAVHQGDTPDGSRWLISLFGDAPLFDDEDGNYIIQSSSIGGKMLEWIGNDFLGFGDSTFALYRAGYDGRLRLIGSGCSTTQEYSFTHGHNHGRISDRRVLIGAGRRVILVGEVDCATCAPPRTDGWGFGEVIFGH